MNAAAAAPTPAMPTSSRSTLLALAVGLVYLLAGVLWILVSDDLLHALAADADSLSRMQTLKGWFYVASTAVALTVGLRWLLAGWERTMRGREAMERRYRLLFESSPHPMWIHDAESLRFLAVNQAMAAFYGHSREELAHMALPDLEVSDPGTDREAEASTAALHGSADVVRRHRLKDGREVWMELSWHEMEFDGHRAGVVFAHDVSARVEAARGERELQARLEKLVAERTAELEAKNRDLEAFTYSVSHDLKAPLRGIDGYSQLLEEDHAGQLDTEGRHFLRSVRKAASQMGQLIDDLLSYSRLERRALQRVSAPLRRLGEEVLREFESDPRLAGARLQIDLPDVTLQTDVASLSMALRNLIDNALKFSRDSLPPEVRVGGRVDNGLCHLWVEDNGPGFEMKFHDRIFEIFQRLHRAEEYPGTGIGLAIVRKAMERLQGRAWADGRPGVGACFHLEFPLIHP